MGRRVRPRPRRSRLRRLRTAPRFSGSVRRNR
jgi:hypothetical protein